MCIWSKTVTEASELYLNITTIVKRMTFKLILIKTITSNKSYATFCQLSLSCSTIVAHFNIYFHWEFGLYFPTSMDEYNLRKNETFKNSSYRIRLPHMQVQRFFLKAVFSQFELRDYFTILKENAFRKSVVTDTRHLFLLEWLNGGWRLQCLRINFNWRHAVYHCLLNKIRAVAVLGTRRSYPPKVLCNK